MRCTKVKADEANYPVGFWLQLKEEMSKRMTHNNKSLNVRSSIDTWNTMAKGA